MGGHRIAHFLFYGFRKTDTVLYFFKFLQSEQRFKQLAITDQGA